MLQIVASQRWVPLSQVAGATEPGRLSRPLRRPSRRYSWRRKPFDQERGCATLGASASSQHAFAGLPASSPSKESVSFFRRCSAGPISVARWQATCCKRQAEGPCLPLPFQRLAQCRPCLCKSFFVSESGRMAPLRICLTLLCSKL